MNVVVVPTAASIWHLQDELGRHLGHIDRFAVDTLVINPGPLLPDLHLGPFLSLALALSEIDRETHGSCRMVEPS